MRGVPRGCRAGLSFAPGLDRSTRQCRPARPWLHPRPRTMMIDDVGVLSSLRLHCSGGRHFLPAWSPPPPTACLCNNNTPTAPSRERKTPFPLRTNTKAARPDWRTHTPRNTCSRHLPGTARPARAANPPPPDKALLEKGLGRAVRWQACVLEEGRWRAGEWRVCRPSWLEAASETYFSAEDWRKTDFANVLLLRGPVENSQLAIRVQNA